MNALTDPSATIPSPLCASVPLIDPGPAQLHPHRCGRLRGALRSIRSWFVNVSTSADEGAESDSIEWMRIIPYMALHASAITVIWVGWSPTAVAVAAVLYFLRMFAITGFYHRYFSHRTFKTSRFCQFLFAVAGNSAVQRGPLWWAAHHRDHHRHSDTEKDVHSPHRHGFWWSHVGWISSRSNGYTRMQAVPDLAKYPELRFLDRFEVLVPLLLAASLFALGWTLERFAPALGADGLQMLVWGFVISTIVLAHATFSINSLAHLMGRQRFQSGDQSRNSLSLALITLGEGWHNNHHYFPGAARQGFFWWELDVTYYLLRLLAALGIVWDLNPVPTAVRANGRFAPK